MSNAYEDCQRSLLAYCKNFLTRNSISGFEVFDFDAHAVEQQLPDSDLIGIGEYSIENQTDMHHVTCMLIICTKSDDTSLDRLRPVMGAIYKELVPGNTGEILPVVDNTGMKRGYLTVMDNVLVGPVGSTKTRPIQAVGLSFGVGYATLPV